MAYYFHKAIEAWSWHLKKKFKQCYNYYIDALEIFCPNGGAIRGRARLRVEVLDREVDVLLKIIFKVNSQNYGSEGAYF